MESKASSHASVYSYAKLRNCSKKSKGFHDWPCMFISGRARKMHDRPCKSARLWFSLIRNIAWLGMYLLHVHASVHLEQLKFQLGVMLMNLKTHQVLTFKQSVFSQLCLRYLQLNCRLLFLLQRFLLISFQVCSLKSLSLSLSLSLFLSLLLLRVYSFEQLQRAVSS